MEALLKCYHAQLRIRFTMMYLLQGVIMRFIIVNIGTLRYVPQWREERRASVQWRRNLPLSSNCNRYAEYFSDYLHFNANTPRFTDVILSLCLFIWSQQAVISVRPRISVKLLNWPRWNLILVLGGEISVHHPSIHPSVYSPLLALASSSVS
jgi:hypothetical protein